MEPRERVQNLPELELLARTIRAEARGEPLEGQIAVGNVIMNRVRNNPRFPDSIRGVIMKRKQFSCTRPKDSNFKILLEPAPERYAVIAEMVIGGLTIDVSEGADHYFNGRLCWPYWAKKMRFVKKIGQHRFYRE